MIRGVLSGTVSKDRTNTLTRSVACKKTSMAGEGVKHHHCRPARLESVMGIFGIRERARRGRLRKEKRSEGGYHVKRTVRLAS